MRLVRKFAMKLDDSEQELDLPADAKILHLEVRVAARHATLRVELNPADPPAGRKFIFTVDEQEVPGGFHWVTSYIRGDCFQLHLYEKQIGYNFSGQGAGR